MLRCFFVCFFVFSSMAQSSMLEPITIVNKNTPIDSITLQVALKNILTLKNKGNYKEAFNVNIKLLQQIPDSNSVFFAEALYMRSRVEIDLGKYNQSISTIKDALQIFKAHKDKKNCAAAYNLIGVGFYLKSQLDSTLYYYRKSFDLKKELKLNPEQLAISSYNLGIVYEDLAQYDEAIRFYTFAIDNMKQLPPEKSFLPSIYLATANTYKNKNDIVKAKEYTTLALHSGLALYGKENPEMSFVYESNAAVFQETGDFLKAKHFAVLALNLRKKHYGNTHRWTTQGYIDLAEILMKTKALDSATLVIDKAIFLAKKINNNIDLADAYAVKSLLLKENKEYQKAHITVSLSRKFNEKVYGTNHKFVAQNYLDDAKIYALENKTKKMQDAINNALKSASYTHEDLSIISAPFVALETLSLFFTMDSSTEKKLALLEQEIALVEHIKKLYHTAQSKYFFNSKTTKLLNNGIVFCFQEYTKTKNQKYVDMALQLVQLNTNSVLAEERHSVYNKNNKNTKREVLERAWAKTNQDLFYEETATKPSHTKLDSLLTLRVEISRQLDIEILKSKEKSPKQNNTLQLLSVHQIQNNLSQNQQILQYYVGKNYVFAFVIDKLEVSFVKLKKTSTIIKEVHVFRQNIVERKELSANITELSEHILPSMLANSKKELILILDGVLSYIPFEILKLPSQEKLLSTYHVSYQSAISLINVQQNDLRKYKNYWAGFGVSYTGKLELPKGTQEVKTIANITNGLVFLNKDVTRENLFSKSVNSEILHLSMHGRIDEQNPLYSSFLLDDDEITASDIYNQTIHAKMVVLSACETGYGKLQKGEGVMSLSRAFTYSGAASTVMSLWEVPDSQTEQLMILFYKNLEKGMSKVEALQKAKLTYIAKATDPFLQHPFYWAGFVLSGDTSPLQNKTPAMWWYILGVLTIAFVGYSIYVNNSKKRVS